MRTFTFLVVMLAADFRCFADYSLEDISPHFSTNMPIIWQAPTNHLPKILWTYKKQPRVFSAATISNAIVLAGFQNKGFPKPSKFRTFLRADHPDSEPMPPYFALDPALGQISYSLGDRAPDSTEKVSQDKAAVERAWHCLGELGIDRTQFVKTNAAASGTWGAFFPRQIDGIQIYDESEGFSFQQFASGKVRCFFLAFPNLKREKQSQTASPQQIIACIRAFKTPSPPNGDEQDYFGRIKTLGTAKKLTIIRITPYYGEGIYGETPTNDSPPKFVSPIAQLEAVADFGKTNLTVRLLSPISEADVARLLKTK